MGDVHCTNCREPWDAYHVRWDAPFDAVDHGVTLEEAEEVRKRQGGLAAVIREQRWRDAMAGGGWVFGSSILVILRCPCCKDDPGNGAEARRYLAETAAELMGDDEDGLQSMLEDLDRGDLTG